MYNNERKIDWLDIRLFYMLDGFCTDHQFTKKSFWIDVNPINTYIPMVWLFREMWRTIRSGRIKNS